MKREELTIGDKVIVCPDHTNKDLPAPKPFKMVVRELHNPHTAGLSHRKNSRSCYGIIYDVIRQKVK